MMKKRWEIKKLGDVCEVLNGLWIGKKEPFINVAVIRNTNFSKDCKLKLDDVAYLDVEVKHFEKRKLKPGDIIIEKSGGSEKQPVGRPVLFDIQEGDYSFSNFTSALRIKSNYDILPKYLHDCLYRYYTIGETRELQSKTTGLHNLDMKGFLRFPIPVPPLSEQEHIVSELDLLSGVIEKKKQQLKELDNLAQAIFFDMFGDPIANDKGWETRLFADCYKLSSGKGLTAKQIIPGDYPIYGGNGIVGFHYEYNLDGENIIIGRVGALCGNVRKVIGAIFVTDNAFILTKKVENDNSFLRALLEIHNLRQYAREGMQPVITNGVLKNISIITPPIELQQQFASKVSAIESQKARIKQSLAEAETLFQSRMSYYFD